MDKISFLKKLIGDNKTDIVIEILYSIFKTNNDIINEIILCKSSLNILRKQILTTDGSQTLIQKNKINEALLSIIDANIGDCMALSMPKIDLYNKEIAVYEHILWNFVDIMNSKNDYEYFLSKYPNSIFAPLAQRAIQNIDENYLEGTVIVHLTNGVPQRFEIAEILTFGYFIDVVASLLEAYVKNETYGKDWILELGHNSHYFLKNGRIIVDDYHSKKVKDIRSLRELGIHDKTTLYVKMLDNDSLIDNSIYSDVEFEYQKSVCIDLLEAEDSPNELVKNAQKKLQEIKAKTINVYHSNKANDKPKNQEENNNPPATILEGKKNMLPGIEILFYIVFYILCLFFPVLIYLFYKTMLQENVRILDLFSIFFMICMLVVSVSEMWYRKRK